MEDRHVRWPVVVFIVGYHLALFALLPIYLVVATPSPLLIGVTALLVAGGGLSITTGYHRLYSHQAYTASRTAEGPVLFPGLLVLPSPVDVHHPAVPRQGGPGSASRSRARIPAPVL
jgi:stearoyl-CoA desaturase (delta-9 desaturase)